MSRDTAERVGLFRLDARASAYREENWHETLFGLYSGPMPPSDRSYLASLNPAQRKAVEYGTADLAYGLPGPLLIIAGAGTGKTNTLAHRVAHLIVGGADPRRILLMTFTRRAANEMTRRAERIVQAVVPNRASARIE